MLEYLPSIVLHILEKWMLKSNAQSKLSRWLNCFPKLDAAKNETKYSPEICIVRSQGNVTMASHMWFSEFTKQCNRESSTFLNVLRTLIFLLYMVQVRFNCNPGTWSSNLYQVGPHSQNCARNSSFLVNFHSLSPNVCPYRVLLKQSIFTRD